MQVIGEDFGAFRTLARVNNGGVPAIAIVVQSILTLAFIVSSSFESILVFAGFTLGLNTFFTVLGVFVLRWTRPELPRPYRTALYPLPPLLFLGVTGWTLTYILWERPIEGLWGLGIVASGALAFALTTWIGNRTPTGENSSTHP